MVQVLVLERCIYSNLFILKKITEEVASVIINANSSGSTGFKVSVQTKLCKFLEDMEIVLATWLMK